ncbi:sugar phosphate isomerase/epimerase family protein [Paenibacillus eucommiae]|uniref:Sugar phosphate isomerase/epimerase n=1 Tax=Paenibacillus eucommiae TaxID=1355755 RepID=A0ABS4JAF6_9BACL|nr:sugar phosphate isomerase/epimerase family protein [Paenibacillus eucommiae]MBP1996086.1 sugar phosphate isomerase/epimerase [Paenibacillus eucommiae]
MKMQNFKKNDAAVIKKFIESRKASQFEKPRNLNLSWSNWGFGPESLEVTAARLEKNNVRFIELHGNRYGQDLGYKTKETKSILDAHGIQVSGVCGMVSPESEFASKNHFVRQQAIDYFRRNIDLAQELGGSYILFSPGAVGRPQKYDNSEVQRAADTIRVLGDYFVESGVYGALEPVRADEVSLCHTFADAQHLIDLINHPGVQHIAGDVFHMLLNEEHIASTILEYGPKLINLHLADTNRRALGTGTLDIDLIIMALHIIGFNNDKSFCSAEPLGAGANPYNSMYELTDTRILDDLVSQTASYFYEREAELLNASEAELEQLLAASSSSK